MEARALNYLFRAGQFLKSTSSGSKDARKMQSPLIIEVVNEALELLKKENKMLLNFSTRRQRGVHVSCWSFVGSL